MPTWSAVLRLVRRHAIVAAILLRRRLDTHQSPVPPRPEMFLPENTRMVAEEVEVVGSRSRLGVEEDRSFGVCQELVLAVKNQEPRSYG